MVNIGARPGALSTLQIIQKQGISSKVGYEQQFLYTLKLGHRVTKAEN